jgi:hypothetical protein
MISPEFNTTTPPPFEPVAELDARAEDDTERQANLKQYLSDIIDESWLPPDDPHAPRVLTEIDGHQVMQFNYHKSKDGEFETEPRVIMATAVFRGEHPEHSGQGEDNYLHGVQLDVDENGQLVIPENFDDSNAKNFAANSIWGLAQGHLVDAKTGEKISVASILNVIK